MCVWPTGFAFPQDAADRLSFSKFAALTVQEPAIFSGGWPDAPPDAL